MSSVAFFISRKISISGNDNGKSPAVRVALAAVALSLAVMLAAIAIVLGFKREIRSKVIGFNSHITLSASQSAGNNEEVSQPLLLSPSLSEILDKESYIESYSLDLSVPSVVKTENDFKGLYIKGIDKNANGRIALKSLEAGDEKSVFDNKDRIIISRIAADELNISPQDSLLTYFITDKVNVRKLEVAGIFNTHFDNYDDVYAYVPLEYIQEVTGKKAYEGSAIQITTKDFDSIPLYTSRLTSRLRESRTNGLIYQDLNIVNALHQGAPFFAWLSLLDTNVIVILVLMMIVSAVTMISGLLIVITDNFRTIATLKAIGSSNRLIRKVFIYLSMKIAIAGMIWGNALMLVFLWLQKKYRFIPLDADTYYIDYVPVELNWLWIILLNVSMLVIVFCSLVVPSRKVASISPAEVLKSE